MAVCNGDVCKSISHMMMNDRESTRLTFAAVKIKNLKQHTKTMVRSMQLNLLMDLQYTWKLERFNG